jgi:hypothetical protein
MAAQYMHLLYPAAAAAPNDSESALDPEEPPTLVQQPDWVLDEPDWYPPAVMPPAAAPEGPPAAAPAADAEATLAQLHRTRVLVLAFAHVLIIDHMIPDDGLLVVIESLSQALDVIDRMITDAEFDYIVD